MGGYGPRAVPGSRFQVSALKRLRLGPSRCLFVNQMSMATATKFEDLEVWQIAFDLVKEVYAFSRKPPFSRDFSLKDQVRRAATSSMTNIAEGFCRRSATEFTRFLDIARSSGAEVQSLLYVARSQDYISDEQFDACYSNCQTLRFKIGALIRYLGDNKATAQRVEEPGTWNLEPGTWNLEPGTWNLELF